MLANRRANVGHPRHSLVSREETTPPFAKTGRKDRAPGRKFIGAVTWTSPEIVDYLQKM
jgi:hypothetical protein